MILMSNVPNSLRLVKSSLSILIQYLISALESSPFWNFKWLSWTLWSATRWFNALTRYVCEEEKIGKRKNIFPALLEDDHLDNLLKPHPGGGSTLPGLAFSSPPFGRCQQKISLFPASFHLRCVKIFNMYMGSSIYYVIIFGGLSRPLPPYVICNHLGLPPPM